MPRIPEDELERLKKEISLVRLAESAGIELKRHGQDLLGLCPFHDDKTPSLVITPDKNLWHCLGRCNAGGSVIDWVMKTNGVSFRHAVELLRNDPSSLAASASSQARRSLARKLDAPFQPSEDDQAALNQVIGYYHETLKQSPEALAYLEKRGIQSAEAIERFKLGYANRTLAYRLPGNHTKEGAARRGKLQRLGVLRASGHEHFNGSLVIPILDEAGNVVQAYGRKVRDDLRPGTPSHLYLPGPHRGVWNADALKGAEEVILCEALIDALSFWCAGYRNVTASYGVNGFTNDHLAAFKQHHIKRVLIAYDRDDAGETAAQRLAGQLIAEGLDAYRIAFPKGMDANAYALHVQPATKSLGVAIRSAAWLGKGAPQPITTEAVVFDTESPAPASDTAAPIAPATSEEGDTPARAGLSNAVHVPHELVERADELNTSDVSPSDPSPSTSLRTGLAAAVEPETLPAQRVPRTPQELPAEVSDEEIIITLGERRYRIRGLAKNLSYESLRVNVLVCRPAPAGAGELLHVDTFDLYSARHRAAFVKQAALELALKEDIVKKDLGAVLLKLEALQDAHIKKALEPKAKTITLSDADEREALTLLKEPKLLDRLLADFEACGVVGEHTNKLAGYLATVSRKLDKPLAVIVQSTSAAGKSALMEACLAFVPEEERIQYSAMTGQALYYMGGIDLKHKILALAEEQGAARASYALKLLQSEGVLTIASTAKDPETGRLETQTYSVEGPVMIFMTTTAIDIDDELLNRCLVLSVDEDREQTRAIHQLQREAETLEGLLAKEERSHLVQLHQNAQRLLKPLYVVNPYARLLTFPDTATRTRRDHMKYLVMIRAIALLHQHQRPVKTMMHRGEAKEYVEVTLDDIEVANQLAHDVLGRTLDELPPQTRRLLLLVDAMVREACEKLSLDRADYRFSRRAVREYANWSDFQVKVHMHKLEELEYVLVHRGGRGQSFVYELLYDGKGQDGKPFVPGLLDVEQLRHAYDKKKEHPKANVEGSSSPQVAGKEPPGSEAKNNKNTGNQSVDPACDDEAPENALLGEQKSAPSYRSRAHPSLAASTQSEAGG
jgi:DNA primase catalytic core